MMTPEEKQVAAAQASFEQKRTEDKFAGTGNQAAIKHCIVVQTHTILS